MSQNSTLSTFMRTLRRVVVLAAHSIRRAGYDHRFWARHARDSGVQKLSEEQLHLGYVLAARNNDIFVLGEFAREKRRRGDIRFVNHRTMLGRKAIEALKWIGVPDLESYIADFDIWADTRHAKDCELAMALRGSPGTTDVTMESLDFLEIKLLKYWLLQAAGLQGQPLDADILRQGLRYFCPPWLGDRFPLVPLE